MVCLTPADRHTAEGSGEIKKEADPGSDHYAHPKGLRSHVVARSCRTRRLLSLMLDDQRFPPDLPKISPSQPRLVNDIRHFGES